MVPFLAHAIQKGLDLAALIQKGIQFLTVSLVGATEDGNVVVVLHVLVEFLEIAPERTQQVPSIRFVQFVLPVQQLGDKLARYLLVLKHLKIPVGFGRNYFGCYQKLVLHVVVGKLTYTFHIL